jgi:predicted TIM-barrel fold metal-dependent hydrolase
MRVIDMHTHLPGKANGVGRRTTRDFLAMLDRAGIDQAVVLTLEGFFSDPVAANNALAQQASESGGRLIPFCTVDPRADGAVAEVRRCVEGLGFRGLKFHPWLQGFSPLEDFMLPIAAEAARLGVPLLFHDGTPCYATPLQVAYLADRFPRLTIILGHGGLMDLWVEAIAAVKRYPNCHVCLCGSAPPAIFARVIADVDVAKVTIGTDAGFGDDYGAVFRMAEFHALQLSEPDREAIYWRNATRLLRIE